MRNALQRLRRRYWALYEWRKLWRPALGDARVQAQLLYDVLGHVLRVRRRGSANPEPVGVAHDARRLLFISYFSPPYKSVFGTQRLSKFIKYLGRSGWHITIVTTAPLESHRDAAAQMLGPDVEVVRLPPAPLNVPHLRGVAVPDHFIRWVAPALQAGRELVQRHRPSAIFATVPPYSNALAAMLLSMETGVPLVTDFRDPWTRIDVAWVLRNRVLRWSSGLLERLVLRSSAAIVMADEIRYRDEFFPPAGGAWEQRIVSILNGYDDEDFDDVALATTASATTRFVVSYVGTFYDRACFLSVKRAFEGLEQSHPGNLDDVEFHYAGPDSKLFDEHDFRRSYVRDQGYVSHRAAIELRARSSLQLFCQPPTFKQHVISGKIYEMMRMPVPILAITHPAGSVARFIASTGTGVVADNRDPESAARALETCYVAWKSGKPVATRNSDNIVAFSRARRADELARVFERVVGSVSRADGPCEQGSDVQHRGQMRS